MSLSKKTDKMKLCLEESGKPTKGGGRRQLLFFDLDAAEMCVFSL